MYENYYGLRELPFELVPNPRYTYLTAGHREALSNLHYGLSTARGLTLLVGEAGTGKTTLLQTVLGSLPDGKVRVVLVSNPTLRRDEFYELLARSFGLSSDAAASKTRFLFELRRDLQERHLAGRLTGLILDEGQSLPTELLEEVRLLSNIETSTVKLLNVVLAGQPELADRLNQPAMRQLKQRISLRCHLHSLNIGETAAYIAGRLRMAGGAPETIFTREAVGHIHRVTAGLPRTINVVCDNALIAGFAGQVKPVTARLVEEVCRDFDISFSGAADPEEPSTSMDVSAGAPPLTANPTEDAGAREPMFSTASRKRRFSFF